MTQPASAHLTPLTGRHRALGARMVDFAGYEMPLSYEGIVAEHVHCRTEACVFDVSHMGQVELWHPDGPSAAAAALERLVPTDLMALPEGRQRYTLLTNDAGGVRDDIIVARRDDRLALVVNAALKADDVAYLTASLPGCDVRLLEDRALIAVQGPQAGDVLAGLAPESTEMRFMDVREISVGGAPALVTRSGYTGEDGFEISVAADHAEGLFDTLLADDRVAPAGLGARDTLRLEAGLCLMGQELDATTSPVEAALEWSMGKARRAGGARAGGFPGADRILAELKAGAARRRVGFAVDGRAPIRAGTELFSAGGDAVGKVTSGSHGPSLNRPVAMGYVERAFALAGTPLVAQLRGREVPVSVAELPFVAPRQKRKATG